MKTNALLAHILSPLEQAAMRRKFKPFNYPLDGTPMYIAQDACTQLQAIITKKVELMTWSATLEQKSKRIPFKLRETFYDVRNILSLPPRLRNCLCELECYNLVAIMHRGRSYFVEQKFGAKSMQALDALFAKYNCSHLFE